MVDESRVALGDDEMSLFGTDGQLGQQITRHGAGGNHHRIRTEMAAIGQSDGRIVYGYHAGADEGGGSGDLGLLPQPGRTARGIDDGIACNTQAARKSGAQVGLVVIEGSVVEQLGVQAGAVIGGDFVGSQGHFVGVAGYPDGAAGGVFVDVWGGLDERVPAPL